LDNLPTDSRELPQPIDGKAVVGDIPPDNLMAINGPHHPRWFGPQDQAYTARLQGVLYIVIVSNQILYL
jgi:hypothetical protein